MYSDIMFERFTDRARRVLVIAQEEARTLEHSFIRPEHLLLGLVRGEGLASTALREAGVRYAVLRERFVEAVAPTPNAGRLDKVPFSPQAKKTLELSLREALKLGHNYIGTEHLLLGVLRGGTATRKTATPKTIGSTTLLATWPASCGPGSPSWCRGHRRCPACARPHWSRP